MSGKGASRNHHWWPVGLQKYWADKNGDVSWIDPSGNTSRKKYENRKIGLKIHGHTFGRGSPWETNFENEFDIDNEVHSIIEGVSSLKPFGRTPTEFLRMMQILFRKNRSLRDMSKFSHLDEKLHRKLLLLINSLLIRSPANRFKYESYPTSIGLPPHEDTGKANMSQNYRIAKRLCQGGSIFNHFFVVMHSPVRRFVFGDGSLDHLTDGLIAGRINGRALIPLTPQVCVYFCTPMKVNLATNCASLYVAPWIVDWINEIIQIYSREKIFYLGNPPKLIDAFRKGEFFVYENNADPFIEALDELAGIRKRQGSVSFSTG